MGKLKDEVASLYKAKGNNIKDEVATTVFNSVKNNDNKDISAINLNDITKGFFYFAFYGLGTKKTKMEQYVPILIIDIKSVKNKKIIYALTLNFIPTNIRLLYFDNMLNSYKGLYEKNILLDNTKQKPLNNLNYDIVYKSLYTVGFEYAIREYDLEQFNKLWKISFNYLPQFIIMNTQKFTGVDEGKLMEIWKAKIKKQDKRNAEIIKKLQSNYDEINDIFKIEFDNLNKINEQINKNLEKLK